MLSVSPRHEFIQLCDLVIGDAAENVGERQVLTPSGHEHSRRIVQSSKIAGAAMGAWITF